MTDLYVDASQFQEIIDVPAYRAARYSRIAHRATFRDTGVDGRFLGRWPTFTGLTRQAYAFAYEGDNPPVAAGHFLSTVDAAGGFAAGDEAMLDLEWFQDANGVWQGLNPIHGKAYAHAWNDAVAAAEPNVRRFFYGNSWWLEAAGITEADFPNVGLITAAYGSGYRVPAGWSHSCIWQFTDTQTVPGFPGEHVDCNRVVCPTNLAHLTIGDDPMTPADFAKIEAMVQATVSAGVQYTLKAILGATPAGEKTPPSLGAIKSELNVILGAPKSDGTDGDPTHFGLGDIGRMVTDVPALTATKTVQAVTPAIESAVSHATQNPSLAGVTGTFTVEAK